MSPPPTHEAGHTALAGRLAAILTAPSATRGRAAVTLVVALCLGFLAFLYGRHIHVDTRLESLLPESAPSLVALEMLAARKSTTADELLVAVVEPDPDARQRMIEGLAETVASWPETERVSTGRDHTSLRDHALYLLEVADLERLRDTLVEQRRKAIARAMGPGLANGPGPDVKDVIVGEEDWDTLDPVLAPDNPSPQGSDAEPIELRKWLSEQKEVLAADGRLSRREVDAIWPPENEKGELVWQDEVVEPFVNDAGDVQLLKADLSLPPTDVDFARAVTEGIAESVAALKAQGIAPDADVRVVAAYNVSREINTILRDARRATVISIVLVVLVLVLGLRGPRGLLLVVVPVGIAMMSTLAIARLLYGELNALTIFLFAVLFGMGVDFAVHLFAHRRAQGRTADWHAVVAAHLRPLASAMATTVASLFVLAIAEFKAFGEFGTITGIGVLLCFAVTLLLVPALDTLLGPLRVGAGKSEREDHGSTKASWPTSGVLRIAALVMVAVVALTQAPKLAFEKDTRALSVKGRKQSGEKDIAYGSAAGRCSKAVVLLGDDPRAIDEAVARLRAEADEGLALAGGIETGKPRKPWVSDVYSVSSLMPEGQTEKRVLLQSIAEHANTFLAELPDLDEEARRYETHLEGLERLARAAPLEPHELPSWALDPFRETDGRFDRIALLCADIEAWHIDELAAMDHHLRKVLPEGVHHVDSRLVFADLVGTMERDSRRLPIIALLVVLAFIALDLRRPIPTLACFASLLLGLGFVVGVMGFWPVHLSFFNLVVMPAVIGLGIDASIHLWHGRKGTHGGATNLATVVAGLTTVVGFAGLLVAEHPGLRSIGVVGVLGICTCVGVAFLALIPFGHRRPK